MKYEVIARRYRPRQFDEVVGQESIAQTLRGAILQDRLAHAYLLAGPRGVGKTSMARIFAKALNCPQAADRSPGSLRGQPCDACATCQAIHTGQDIDVIEMDGASHRGIEDIRNILEGVNRPATRSPYKVYIIDEVHMLTREAFNALLKTLEEPPGHVKFVFATTEAHKIPDTVLSRCQRFDFHPIGEEGIVRRLEQICAAEGREAEPGLFEKVARYGKGGLRDAQTLLDQLMTFAEGPLRAEDLDRITGRVPEASIRALTGGLRARDPAAVLAAVRDCFACGADPAVLLEQVIEDYHLRLVELVTRGAGGPGPLSGESDEAAEIDLAVGSLQMLLEAATRLRSSSYPEVAVEVTLLKLSRMDDPRALDRALAQLREIERRGEPPPAVLASPQASRTPAPPSLGTPPRERAPAGEPRSPTPPAALETEGAAPAMQAAESAGPAAGAPAVVFDFARLGSLWEQICIEIQSQHPEIAPYLKDASPLEPRSDVREGILVLGFGNEFYHRQMKLPRRLEVCERVVREVTAQPWKIRMELHAAPPPAAASGAERPRPELRPAGSRGLAEEPLVKKSIELFNGRLV
jgi:DNA polymerase-3 subunit gamma/tau